MMSSAGVCKALIVASVLGHTSCASWDLGVLDTATSASQPSKAFDALVQPLAEMSKLAYTSTAGSYFKPESLTETPGGWRRVLTWDPAVGYGMRAIVFVEDVEEPKRIVIAFRGTDLDKSGIGGQADACMNSLASSRALPEFCSRLPGDRVDYMVAVKQLLGLSLWRLPGQQVLFTGHSLGCGLATAAQLHVPGSKCVCFSQPAISNTYWDKHKPEKEPGTGDRSPLKAAEPSVFVLADDQDPVYTYASAQRLLHGKECVWKTAPSAECKACRPPQEDDSCKACFMVKHAFRHYLILAYHQTTYAETSYKCLEAAAQLQQQQEEEEERATGTLSQ